MRTRLAAAAIGAAALLTISACSSNSSDDKADPPTSTGGVKLPPEASQVPDKAALTKAVADYTAKLFSGDPDGYDYLSARCKQQLTHDAWNDLAKQGHQQYGSQKATGIHVDQLSGDLARVSYGAGNIPDMERKGQPWTREGGTWRWDACQTTS
ncbi:hypothetical protein ACWERV_17110 [Streptomyces sp. NPDC004031]